MYIETENYYIPFNQENRRAELLSNIRQYGTYIHSIYKRDVLYRFVIR